MATTPEYADLPRTLMQLSLDMSGKSQVEVAEDLRVSAPAINRWLSGGRSPSFEDLRAFCLITRGDLSKFVLAWSLVNIWEKVDAKQLATKSGESDAETLMSRIRSMASDNLAGLDVVLHQIYKLQGLKLGVIAALLDAVLRKFKRPGLAAWCVTIWGNNLGDGIFKTEAIVALGAVKYDQSVPLEWRLGAWLSLGQLNVEGDNTIEGAANLREVLEHYRDDLQAYQVAFASLFLAEAELLSYLRMRPDQALRAVDVTRWTGLLQTAIAHCDKAKAEGTDRRFWRARAGALLAAINNDKEAMAAALEALPPVTARLRSSRLAALYFRHKLLGDSDVAMLLTDVNNTLDTNSTHVDPTYARRLLNELQPQVEPLKKSSAQALMSQLAILIFLFAIQYMFVAKALAETCHNR